MVPVSPPVVLLLVIALGACFFAWWHLDRGSARWRDLAAWVKANHGQVWTALPWALRAFNLRGALMTLERGALAQNPEFITRYQACQTGGGKVLLGIAVGAGAIALLLLGVNLLGWRW